MTASTPTIQQQVPSDSQAVDSKKPFIPPQVSTASTQTYDDLTKTEEAQVNYRHHLATGDDTTAKHVETCSDASIESPDGKDREEKKKNQEKNKFYRHHLASGTMGPVVNDNNDEKKKSCCIWSGPVHVACHGAVKTEQLQAIKDQHPVKVLCKDQRDKPPTTITTTPPSSVAKMLTDTQQVIKRYETSLEAKRLKSERLRQKAMWNMLQNVFVACITGQTVMVLGLFGLVAFLK